MTRNDKHFLIGNENIFAIKKPDKSSEKKKKKKCDKICNNKNENISGTINEEKIVTKVRV